MITAEIPVTRPASGPPPGWGQRSEGKKAWVEQIMGLPVSIHVRASEPTRPEIAEAVGRAFAHLRRADRVFSTWRTDSDLLRLQHGELDSDDIHPWLADVAELCLAAEERTDGLFRAWRGGGEGGRSFFDPTGLVKGWAVAGAGEHLAVVPEIAWCIGAGGDLVMGTGRGMYDVNPVWRIGVENPLNRNEIGRIVTLSRGGVATSGAAARGGHVIDPRTHEPITRPGSCTVVGPDLVWADVWATAAWVDPLRADALMRERDADYRLITL